MSASAIPVVDPRLDGPVGPRPSRYWAWVRAASLVMGLLSGVAMLLLGQWVTDHSHLQQALGSGRVNQVRVEGAFGHTTDLPPRGDGYDAGAHRLARRPAGARHGGAAVPPR